MKMNKTLFYNDYSEGAHPEVLKYLAAHNLDQQIGYGLDDYCELAGDRIKNEIGIDAAIHFECVSDAGLVEPLRQTSIVFVYSCTTEQVG